MSSLEITYDLDDISSNSKMFVNKLSFLTNIKKGEKPYINSDELITIDTTNLYFQSISRWIFNQNRDNMYNVIQKLLDSYIVFLQLLGVIVKEKEFNLKQKNLIAEIISTHNDNSQQIIPGLTNLVETYSDYDDFVSCINNYIIKLNSFHL